MRGLMYKVNEKSVKVYSYFASKGEKIAKDESGWGASEFLGLVALITCAAFVTVPSLRTFAGTVFTKLNSWWTSLGSTLFPTS